MTAICISGLLGIRNFFPPRLRVQLSLRDLVDRASFPSAEALGYWQTLLRSCRAARIASIPKPRADVASKKQQGLKPPSEVVGRRGPKGPLFHGAKDTDPWRREAHPGADRDVASARVVSTRYPTPWAITLTLLRGCEEQLFGSFVVPASYLCMWGLWAGLLLWVVTTGFATFTSNCTGRFFGG